MLDRISDDATFADFIFAYLELRFDQRHNSAAAIKQWNYFRQNFRRRYKSDIDRDQIKSASEIVWREISRIHPFAQLNAWIASQSPIHLIVTYVDSHNFLRLALQEAVSETAGR